jgi:hypothetical protein
METGSYHRRLDFDSFVSDKFVAHISTGSDILAGCGATALSLLTGDRALHIGIRKRDWDSGYMARYLRRRGFRVARLTLRNLTNFGTVESPITRGHVVLARIKFLRGEASWIIIHNGMVYHNFEITELKPYSMLNHPVMEAFLVSHPSWGGSIP